MKLKRVIAIVCTAFLSTSMFTNNINMKNANAAEDTTESSTSFEKLDKKEDLRFAVVSDTHIASYNTKEQERLKKVFKTCNDLDENMDAITMVGDLTDSGCDSDYSILKDIIDNNKSDSLKLIASMGNHEGNSAFGFKAATGNDPRQNITINGYHFITISPRTSDKIYGGSRYNLDADWLRQQLDAAVKEDPTKPIFVFQHHGIKDTCYLTNEWYTEDLKEVLNDYPQVVDVSGHSHAALNDPLSISQDNFTAINTATTSYFEMESGMMYGTIPPDAHNACQMMVVDVKGAEVRIKKLDLLSGKYIGDDWVFDISKGKDGFVYNDTVRANTSKIPYFTDDNKVTVNTVDDSSCNLTINQASIDEIKGDNNDDIVQSYRFDFINNSTNEVDKSYKIWSEFYILPTPGTITQDFTGLTPGTQYTVKVTAINAYGKESTNTISADFKTEGEFKIPTDEELANINVGNGDILDVDFTDSEGKDTSETNNEVTVVGNPSINFDDNLHKNVASFDGNSAYSYQFDDEKYSKITDNMTISSTFKLDSVSDPYEDIIGNMQSAGIGYEISKIDGNNDYAKAELWIRIEDANGYNSYKILSTEIPYGEYVNLTSTYDGKTIKLYNNGLLKDSLKVTGKVHYPDDPSKKICIGADVSVSGGIEGQSNGKVSDLRLYSSALNPSEVYKLYKNDLKDNLDNYNKVTDLSFAENYIKTNINEGIDLSSVKLNANYEDASTSELSLNDVQITNEDWFSIEDNKLVVKTSGYHELKVEKDGKTATLKVLSKDASSKEYVLYEENFDNIENGTVPEGYSFVNADLNKAAVNDGKLILNGLGDNYTASRVILPSYIGEFGNYDVTADVSMLKANNNSRWASLAYRIQDGKNNYQFYQMAVRQNATASNGIEFAQRAVNDAWNVMNIASYTESLDPNKEYKFEVKTYGSKVQELINDKLLINTSNASEYQKGSIGFNTAGCKVSIDNVKVVIQEEDLPKTNAEKYVDVNELTTNIKNAPTSILKVNSAEDLSVLENDTLPANMEVMINDDLDVVNNEGNKIISLDSFIKSTDSKVIPLIEVESSKAAENLVTYLKDNEIVDVTIISEKPELIKKIRTDYNIVRGVLKVNDTTKLTKDRMMEIVKETNSSLAKTVVINPEIVSKSDVRYMQKRLISVWSKTSGSSTTEMYKLINAGVNGIITSNFNTLVNAYNTYDANTLVRSPIIIGHRGLPSQAPENTMDSVNLALQHGAEIVENDIYLTKDNQIVIMHDDTLDRTTNRTGNVEDYTLAELKALNANKQFTAQFPNAKIPTLQEYFDAVKGTDKLIFIEIKTANPNIIKPLSDIIEQNDMESQVVLISFNTAQINLANEEMPWVSKGFLNGINETGDLGESIYSILNSTAPMNATFNPAYQYINTNIVEELKHRGMTFWPWTYNNYADFKSGYLNGIYGITTNYSNWSENWLCDMQGENEEYDINLNDVTQINGIGTTYLGENKNVDTEIVPIDNNNVISVDGNNVTALKTGTAEVMLKTKVKTDNESNDYYVLYSEPIKVNVSEKADDLTIDNFTCKNENSSKVGQAVKVTANANGGNGNISYKFIVMKDGEVTYARGFSSKNKATWTPTDDGDYTVEVIAKDSKGTTCKKVLQHKVTRDLKINSYDVTNKDGVLNLKVNAEGTGNLKYKFEVLKDNNKLYVRDYSSRNNAEFTPDEEGIYTIRYIVKDETGKEISKHTVYEIDSPVIIENFGSNYDNKKIITGKNVKLFAEASGEDLSYKFVVFKDGEMEYVRGYKSSNTAIWTPNESGNYMVYYKVKDSNGNETYKTKQYTID